MIVMGRKNGKKWCKAPCGICISCNIKNSTANNAAAINMHEIMEFICKKEAIGSIHSAGMVNPM
jgi:hypothetical protein